MERLQKQLCKDGGKVEETVTEEPLKILNKATEQKVPERMEEYIPFIRFYMKSGMTFTKYYLGLRKTAPYQDTPCRVW